MLEYLKLKTMKNFKAVSMDCNEQQFESMREELIELGCVLSGFTTIEVPGALVNNFDSIDKTIGFTLVSLMKNYGRTYIGEFDKEAFLKACGKIEEVKELPKKWCVEHTPEALEWIRKNAEVNGKNISERNFYMMPCNEAKNNGSEVKPEGYTFLSNDLFKKLVLGTKEVNKSGWYKYQDTDYLMYHNIDTGRKFGFGTSGTWSKELEMTSDCYRLQYFTKAPNEQVLQRLTEEAEKRGYKEGVKVIDINKVEITCHGSFVLGFSGQLHFGGATIMKNGIWADIVPNEIEVVEPVEIGIAKIEFSPDFEVMNTLKKEKTTLLKSRNRYKQLYKQEKDRREMEIYSLENRCDSLLHELADKKEANEELYQIGCQLGSKNDDLKKQLKTLKVCYYILAGFTIISSIIFKLC